jgi:hypothetical protein
MAALPNVSSVLLVVCQGCNPNGPALIPSTNLQSLSDAVQMSAAIQRRHTLTADKGLAVRRV